MSGTSTTGTTCSLVRTRFADPADFEALHTCDDVVLLLFSTSAVEHVSDAGNGQTGFSDVRCEHDEAGSFGRWFEDAELLVCRELGVEWQDVHLHLLLLCFLFSNIELFLVFIVQAHDDGSFRVRPIVVLIVFCTSQLKIFSLNRRLIGRDLYLSNRNILALRGCKSLLEPFRQMRDFALT